MPDGDTLLAVLEEARRLGFLGPGDVAAAMAHAAGFVAVLRPAGRLLDLGSGGGLPGLVIADRLPATEMVLLDARRSRTDFLVRAVGRLGWHPRVTVVTGRAEEVARRTGWRATFDAVVARGFGPPAVVAECAAPFLRCGGQLVVSEPPHSDACRWPAAGLAGLGLRRDRLEGGYASFTQAAPCPDRFPRRRTSPPLF